MTDPLSICPSCTRHIRASESACPFCDTVLDAPLRIPPDTNRRLGRAAAFVFGAAIAVSACGDDVTINDDGSGGSADGGNGQGGDAEGGGGQSAQGGMAPGGSGQGGMLQTLYGAPAVGGGGNSGN